jgi:hypothetical protein
MVWIGEFTANDVSRCIGTVKAMEPVNRKTVLETGTQRKPKWTDRPRRKSLDTVKQARGGRWVPSSLPKTVAQRVSLTYRILNFRC